MSTLIVGIVFGVIFTWAAIQSIKDMKSSKCAGCSGGTCKLTK